jgi:peptidoglycan/LPS O-acetylase OafA/YrhL
VTVDAAELPSASPARLAPGDRPHHVPALDGLRGVTILMVMVFHTSVIGFIARPDRPWVDAAWLRFAMLGWSGVDLFFVLSGLLITGILLDAKAAAGDLRRYFGSFYARRALRVLPLYYAVVCFALLVLPHIPNAKADRFGSIRGDEAWYWTLLSNWIIGYRHTFRHGILDVTWSLSIEEQFYLLWPAVVLLASRRTLGWICGGLMVTSIAARTGLYLLGGSHEAMHVTMLTWTPCRMDGLAAGSALAVLARRPGGLAAWRRTAWWAAAVAGSAIFALQVWQGDNWPRWRRRPGRAASSVACSAATHCGSWGGSATHFTYSTTRSAASSGIGSTGRISSSPWADRSCRGRRSST